MKKKPKSKKKLSFWQKVKNCPKATWRYIKEHRWAKVAVISVGVIFLLITLLLAWYYNRHKDEPTILGVSFSVKYAEELGLNWEEAYTALLRDLEFKEFRLMSYWDLHEKERDVYDFTVLDRQFELAEQYGAKINLAVGERQPRWPECHHPNWVNELNDFTFEEELFEYISIVVERYKDSPALAQYQLENEIFNRLFGECEIVSRERVKAEYDLIKNIDPDHPVVINVSNQSGIPLRQPVGDKVGFSMYRKATGRIAGIEYYWSFWYVPPQWHALRAAVIELLHDSPTFVHELQAEPWGPRATVDLSIEEQNQSMTANNIVQNVKFAEATGMSDIYMWGGEWWYWRKTQWNDPTMWETVRALQNGEREVPEVYR